MSCTCLLFVFLGVILFSLTNSQDETSFWNLGNIPYLGGCVRNGIQIPGIIPPEMDPWPLNLHCNTFNGSVGCFKAEGSLLPYGLCICNQRDAAHPDAFGTGLCLGKVGAFCSAEHHNFFPDKLCTQNAYCKPLQQGSGRTVGKCACLYGYNEVDGKCVMDVNLPDPERSTIPPTTTTEAPQKEEFKLPPLDLLIKVNVVPLEEECNPRALLNKTFCNTFSRTASCLSKKCQCSMQEDAVFDEELQMCVGREGAYCLGRKNALGYKACTKNANCVIEKGKDFEDGYSFGVCECVYGYDPDENGVCVRDEDITDPSTASTIAVTSTTTITTKGTTDDGEDDDRTTTENNQNGSSGKINSIWVFVMILSMTCFMIFN